MFLNCAAIFKLCPRSRPSLLLFALKLGSSYLDRITKVQLMNFWGGFLLTSLCRVMVLRAVMVVGCLTLHVFSLMG